MLAEDLSTGKKVALKMMKNSETRQGIHRKTLFDNEIKALKDLESSNILTLEGYSESEAIVNAYGKTIDVSYIALEYAENGEFFDYIANGEKYSEKTTRFFFHEIINSLEYMHNKGYAHRDIKPENLLFGKDFKLKFADFGFSTEKSICSERRGTFGYMAPEVLANIEHDPKKADIFSAGVILFIMTTKHCPFIKADSNDKYYNLMINNNFEHFWRLHESSNGDTKSFSEEFKDLLNGMLHHDVDERYTIEDIKNHPWFTSSVAKARDIKFEFKLRKKVLDRDETSDQKEETKKSENDHSEVQKTDADSSQEKDIEMTSSESEDLVTNYLTVANGDILVDLTAWYCASKKYSYVKSTDFYRLNLEVGEGHNRTSIEVNILKRKRDGKRAVEFKTLSGPKSVTYTIFTEFQDFLQSQFAELSN